MGGIAIGVAIGVTTLVCHSSGGRQHCVYVGRLMKVQRIRVHIVI